MNELTKEFLHQRFSYCPVDISRPLVFRVNTGKMKKGDPCGSLARSYNYYTTRVLGKSFLIHRLVWLYKHSGCYEYSEVPSVVDHINQNPHDNRYENLRLATRSLNSFNRPKQINGSSSFRGVYWEKAKSKWASSLSQGGKMRFHKYFPGTGTGEIHAALAYDRAAFKEWGRDALSSLNFPENERNYMGLDEYRQLEFSFCDDSPAQKILDFDDVILIR